MTRNLIANWLTVAVLLHSQTAFSAEVRLKDISNVEGVRVIELTGMGLVAGLNGTGGKTPTTREFASSLLQRFGQRLSPQLRATIRNDQQQRTDNLSVVVVSAKMSETAVPGSKLDIIVSAYDDAESIQGGTLILTPLEGVDGIVYATASGPVSVGGGFSFSGDAATAQKNHPTTGRLANGAIVQQCVPSQYKDSTRVKFLLRNPDFETATRIVKKINQVHPYSARAINHSKIEVLVPVEFQTSNVEFISRLQQLRVSPDTGARVVINERTGTVVVGENVRLSKVGITHANLTVSTGEYPEVSQPNEFSDGQTVVVPRTEINVTEDGAPIQVIEETTQVGDLANALNALGVTPRDLSAIFQQLKASGALHGELRFE